MQVIQFLHTTFAAALPQVHATRLRAVLDAVAAALSGAPLSLTGLGRCLPSSALVKHAIKRVDRLVPAYCRPIVITDAGFGRQWFAAVAALGWQYVGRGRNREHFVRPGRAHWYAVTALYRGATPTPQDLGAFERTRYRLPVRVVRVKRPAEGRGRRGRLGRRSADSRSKQCARRAREPWLLVSNLPPHWEASAIVKLYARRMRIEEGFRDLKSVRYGLGLRLQASTTAARLNILLLIGAIAAFAIVLRGLCARRQGYARSYQANTSTTTVLSLFSLGRQWLRRSEHLAVHEWRLAQRALVEAMKTATILA